MLMSSSEAHFPQNLSTKLLLDYNFRMTSEPEFLLRGKQI